MALPKFKVVESIVFEIMGGGGVRLNPPFVEGVGTKYLRTGRVNWTQMTECPDAASSVCQLYLPSYPSTHSLYSLRSTSTSVSEQKNSS